MFGPWQFSPPSQNGAVYGPGRSPDLALLFCQPGNQARDRKAVALLAWRRLAFAVPFLGRLRRAECILYDRPPASEIISQPMPAAISAKASGLSRTCFERNLVKSCRALS